MSSTNFNKMFEESISKISSHLYRKLKDISNQIYLAALDKHPKYKTTIREIKSIQEKIKKLEAQEKELKKKLDEDVVDIDTISENDKNNIMKLFDISYYHNITNVHMTAYNMILKSKEFINKERFDNLIEDVRYTMALAVGKEQRNLLLNFLNQDWKSMGVDIPPLNLVDFKIPMVHNGNIISKDKLLLGMKSK